MIQWRSFTLAVALLAVLHADAAQGQCMPTQLPPNCDNCEKWEEIYLTVCHAGINYNATLEVCTQYGVPPEPIDNPCTPNCDRAVDAITWVRSICVDEDLKSISEPALLQAIVKGTNLCCSTGNFLGVTLPACQIGYGCTNSVSAYCHILAMPRCLKKRVGTGCYDRCTNCQDFCMIERRYCKPSPISCCKAYVTTCNYRPNEAACENCDKKWDCAADYFKASSEVCCD